MIIATAQDAALLFGPAFADAAEGETLAVAYLDDERRLLELVVLPAEAASEVELPMRQILSDGLRLGATGIIVAHNHPSGDPQPSREDIEATRELAETAARLGVRLLDHLIFAGGETCSLREMGLL